MNILLVCAAGMSTSILVSKMKKSLEPDQQDWVIEAHPIGELSDYINNFNVVLLGPQVSHKLKGVEKEYGSYGKPIAVINSLDYGMGNGKKVVEFAIELVHKNNL
ncbi:PTS system cellobiose-specific IIB component [Paenibacillus sp. RC73]|uniref:PTS sugar transporter subunit IIB n=1 Tax=Paenibacillus sp. RC73 TaxID=3156250 RepID=UPI003833DC9B